MSLYLLDLLALHNLLDQHTVLASVLELLSQTLLLVLDESILLRVQIGQNGVVLIRLDSNDLILLLILICQLNKFWQVGNNFDFLFLLLHLFSYGLLLHKHLGETG